MNRTLAIFVVLAMACWLTAPAIAQTTQGLIAGSVTEVGEGRTEISATVYYARSSDREAARSVETQAGRFTLPRLSPGDYWLRVEAGGYRTAEMHALVLPVAARMEVSIKLRKSGQEDDWSVMTGKGQSDFVIVRYFASDVERMRSARIDLLPAETVTRDAAVSYVVDGRALETLPFRGRDPFTALVLQPGVTADSSTSRGLGVSVSGARPSSSNFLLDGGEYNDYLTTGPLTPLVPEAIQEYRISTNNFSAEYGGTTGFVANAVTRSGGEGLHGLVYGYFGRDEWNANTPPADGREIPRRSLEESRFGFSIQGRIPKTRVYFSSQYERYRYRGEGEPESYNVPNLSGLEFESAAKALESLLADHMHRLLPLERRLERTATILGSLSRTIPIDRTLTTHRLDIRDGKKSGDWTLRFSTSPGGRRNYAFVPYEGFSSTFRQRATTFGANHTFANGSAFVNELRFTWRRQTLGWDRPFSDASSASNIPSITVTTGNVRLPGSRAFSDYDGVQPAWELSDSIVAIKGKQVWTAGGGLLSRRPRSIFTFGRYGSYDFDDLNAVEQGAPRRFLVAVSRRELVEDGIVEQPSFQSRQSNNQGFLFLQNTVRATPWLSLNFGLRYERHGVIGNAGERRAYFQPAACAEGDAAGCLPCAEGDPAEVCLRRRVLVDTSLCGSADPEACTAGLVWDGPRSLAPYKPDGNDFAARAGAALRLDSSGNTVLRFAYGTFYDRAFDNYVNTDRNELALLSVSTADLPSLRYEPNVAAALSSIRTLLDPALPPETLEKNRKRLQPEQPTRQPLWIDENLRSPYIHSWFAAIDRTITPKLTLSVSHIGNVGRKLFATDYLNRRGAGCRTRESEELRSNCRLRFDALERQDDARPNPNFDEIFYRSNLTSSSYAALAALVRYRGRRSFLQAAYTWSHTIDEQSDPLEGDFLDNSFVDDDALLRRPEVSAFTVQGQPWLDRGSSDYDQRHNLVLYSSYELPQFRLRGLLGMLANGWRVSQLAAFRSGFPVNVFTGSGDELFNNRPDLKSGQDGLLLPGAVVEGKGVRVLDRSELPAQNTCDLSELRPTLPLCLPGGLGRNAIVGPGFWNVDLSVSKTVSLREGLQAEIRVDAFNAFNHANLSEPFNLMADSDFGISSYGRRGLALAFPSRPPLNEAPRNIQLQLKLRF